MGCLAVDRISMLAGRLAGWLMIVLTGLITWEVGSRYAFSAPHAWAFDAQLIVYGTLFNSGHLVELLGRA